MSLAADFLYNWNTREVNSAFGYDYILRQCRLRGRIDTEGKVGPLWSRAPAGGLPMRTLAAAPGASMALRRRRGGSERVLVTRGRLHGGQPSQHAPASAVLRPWLCGRLLFGCSAPCCKAAPCPQVSAYLEERVNVGVNFVLSAEIDHWRKDYKFGFGMTVGE